MSSSSSLGGGFSFDTPEAVLQILASVRNSAISQGEKNTLRDLILSYTNGGKDPSLKIQITQALASHGMTPAAPAAPAIAALPRPDFGSARAVPTFESGSATAAVAPTTVVPPVPVVPPVATPSSVAPVNIPVAPQPTPTPTPTPAQVPVVSSQPATPTPAPTPVTPTPTSPVSAATTAADGSAALNRIREIKALVNEKVGNPVNLVDRNNELGREYMSALLDAMKKLNTGSGSAEAMQRLETAYAAVETLLKQPAPVVEVEVVAPVAPVPIAPSPEVVVPAAPTSAATAVPIVKVPVAPTPEAVTPPQPPQPPQPAALADEKRWDSVSPAPMSVPTVPVAPVAPLASVVKPLSESRPPLKSVHDLPAKDSLAAAGGDPLMTQEVSGGLQQLLADWTLFKKSGLFGTGANGVQHPLYLKIKDLQIPLLLAGRFEGATQETKQSITDYMNGWRYEQGIVYEQGETFDHYLRRVIRHILDLQK